MGWDWVENVCSHCFTSDLEFFDARGKDFETTFTAGTQASRRPSLLVPRPPQAFIACSIAIKDWGALGTRLNCSYINCMFHEMVV